MKKSFGDIYDFAETKKTTFRDAAFALAINRIGKATANRGILS